MIEGTRVDSTAADTVPCRSSDSYRLVFDAHRAGLARFAYLLGCESHQVDDVVAEAFLATFHPWLSGRVIDVGPYLRRVVANQLKDRTRRQRTRRLWEVRQSDKPVVSQFPADGLIDHERLLAALSTLSDHLRLTVVLRFCDDLSEAQTAELMDVSVGTVKSRTSRALQRLRPLLEETHHD
jgi:RNA polymerase sigma factor (sigma-70 family)